MKKQLTQRTQNETCMCISMCTCMRMLNSRAIRMAGAFRIEVRA